MTEAETRKRVGPQSICYKGSRFSSRGIGMRACTVVMVWAVFAGPACAQVPALCSNASTQTAMNQCAGKAMAKADAELNALYGQLMAKVDPKTKDMAREAQRAWLTFRDKECVSRTGGGPDQGGTIWPALYLECKVALTQARSKDLAEQVKCPGGDLSCPADQ